MTGFAEVLDGYNGARGAETALSLTIRVSWIAFLGLSTLAMPAGCLADRLYEGLKPTPIPHQSPPAGLASLSAKTCQPCHAEIYEEWSGSRMGQAFTEPIFQADWEHQDRFYFCLSCHAPLEAQQPSRITGLSGVNPPKEIGEANPLFDPALQREGVTCVACHLQDGALVGPHEVTAPHPTRADPGFAGAGRCERCHQMIPPPFPFSRADRPLSDTHGEWEEWKTKTGRTETCTDCHMPAIERASAMGAPIRSGRKHTFPGAWDDALVRGGLEVGPIEQVSGGARITLTNQTGHRFPTGEPARALILTLTVFDAAGDSIASAEQRIERKVKLPIGKELGDNTLLPAEQRSIHLPIDAPTARNAARISVSVVFDRLANHSFSTSLNVPNHTVKLVSRQMRWTQP